MVGGHDGPGVLELYPFLADIAKEGLVEGYEQAPVDLPTGVEPDGEHQPPQFRVRTKL